MVATPNNKAFARCARHCRSFIRIPMLLLLIVKSNICIFHPFFLLYAAWVRSRAERPSVSYTKVVSKVARTGHNLQLQRRIKQQNCGSNKFLHRGDGKMKRMLEPSIKLIGEVHRMSRCRVSDAVPGIKPIGKTHRKVESKYVRVSTCAED